MLDTIAYPYRSFDVLLFADILEHLLDPLAVLRRFLPYLRDGGEVVVSLPNIANWTIRLQLLRGRWSYTESGLMDATHLHFYTRATARELLLQAGLHIRREDVTQGLYELPIYRATLHRVLTHLKVQDKVAYCLSQMWPELWALQFISLSTLEGDGSVA